MAMPMFSDALAHRVAIITASTKGIGFAIAKRLGLDGATVVVSSRKEENVQRAVKMLRSEAISADGVVAHMGVAKDRSNLIRYATEKFGRLDIVVSNAAVSPHFGDLLTITDAEWDKLLHINVRSAFFLAQEAVPHLEKTGNGNVVFVSSVAAYAPTDDIGAYSIMKSALNGVNKALSQSLARKKIRVNAIAPGIIRTDLSKALVDDPEKLKHFFNIPLGRAGAADECAGAVAFLVSDGASYLTGETIGIAGGATVRI